MSRALEDAVGRFSRHRPLRCIGWVVAYVLALQTMLFGLAAVPAFTAGASGASVELCLGGNDADAGHPASHAVAQHCLGCFAAAAELPPPPACAAPLRYPTALVSSEGFAPAPPAPDAKGRPGLPRAPPSLA